MQTDVHFFFVLETNMWRRENSKIKHTKIRQTLVVLEKSGTSCLPAQEDNNMIIVQAREKKLGKKSTKLQ